MTTSRPVRIREVRVLHDFVVSLGFTDGSTREVDLTKYLRGPIFESIQRDAVRFREITVDPVAGTVVWRNGADIDPDVLYRDATELPTRVAG